jgi:4-hydroxy-tetrahydrodipicolinate reductase
MIAARFPGAFAGYELQVVESHQSSKACALARPHLLAATVAGSRRDTRAVTRAQVDTSGTAKALVASFRQLGPAFELQDIMKVRDAPQQRAMGVPGACRRRFGPARRARAACSPARGAEEHLEGHAYHTYRLTSPDGLVSFEFQARARARARRARAVWWPARGLRCAARRAGPQHNVCGRSIYAQGTVDAVAFIAARARERAAKTLYNMVDVLSAGMQ